MLRQFEGNFTANMHSCWGLQAAWKVIEKHSKSNLDGGSNEAWRPSVSITG